MDNILIYISYDGTGYSGFQIQANAPTVQELIERALQVIYKEPIRIIFAGRTDAGVHARGQAANFRAPFRIAISRLPYALNAVLPSDIVVTAARVVPDSFHARFDAKRKIYSYTIDQALFPQVTRRLYSLHQADKLNIDRIKIAVGYLEGTHDFKAFQAAGSPVSDTQRTLFSVELAERPKEKIVVLFFEGSGFLYHMVRLFTGTLIRVGKGKLNPGDVKAALEGRKPLAVGPTVPACGLCLEKVVYDL